MMSWRSSKGQGLAMMSQAYKCWPHGWVGFSNDITVIEWR